MHNARWVDRRQTSGSNLRQKQASKQEEPLPLPAASKEKALSELQVTCVSIMLCIFLFTQIAVVWVQALLGFLSKLANSQQSCSRSLMIVHVDCGNLKNPLQKTHWQQLDQVDAGVFEVSTSDHRGLQLDSLASAPSTLGNT